MRRIALALALHSHQPVGNFDSVLEEAYRKAYKPFLDVWADYPDVPVALHYSGPLLTWLEERHPEYLDAIRRLGPESVELIGGAFMEPILTMLPDRDIVGQIKAFRRYLGERFAGQDRLGAWCPERVWEQWLVTPLAAAGVRYTILDDSHFKAAGLRGEDLLGSFSTEDRGRRLILFPGSEDLRYRIPFHEVESVIDFLRDRAAEVGPESGPEPLLVYADDGEKFGSWPETHKHVYEDGWLRRFLEALRKNREWLRVVTFRDAIDLIPPRGLVYLPDASYREMMEWALPPRVQARYHELTEELGRLPSGNDLRLYFRGGTWRNFKAKYPEALDLYARMLVASGRVAQAEDWVGSDVPEVRRAREALYRGQCNCCYWHGIFGGLYLPHLRDAAYGNLIEADDAATRALAAVAAEGDAAAGASAIQSDLDFDGANEVELRTPSLYAYLRPEQGGQLYELDVVSRRYNVLNGLSRREEAYHGHLAAAAAAAAGAATERGGEGEEDTGGGPPRTIHGRTKVKEDGLAERLKYDPYRRLSLVDHLYPPDVAADAVRDGRAIEPAAVRAGRASVIEVGLGPGCGPRALLRRSVRLGSETWHPPGELAVEKQVRLDPGRPVLRAAYRLAWTGEGPLSAAFGVEWNFALLAGKAHDRYFGTPHDGANLGNLSTRLDLAAVPGISLFDWWRRLELALSFFDGGFGAGTGTGTGARVVTGPIETVSQSEEGLEAIYQASTVVCLTDLALESGGPPFEWTVVLEARDLAP